MDKLDIIISRMDRMEGKVDKLILHGCSKAEQHAEVAKKVEAHEAILQQSRGAFWAAAGVAGLFGGISGFIGALIGRNQ